MNITRENIDALNAVVKVDIAKEDYIDKVEKILSEYKKSATIPGFRKGFVPEGMIKKLYGEAVLVDEVNKLLQESLNKYLTEEKIDILGNPLPKQQDDFDWNGDAFSFEFELGLAPEFDVKLKEGKSVIHYNVIADKKMVDGQVETLQKQFGKLKPQKEVEKDSEVSGTFKNEERGVENTINSLSLDKFKGKATEKKFIGAKAGDVIKLKTKGLFDDVRDLMHALKMTEDDAKDLDIDVTFTITEVSKRELAKLDKKLFNTIFDKGEVKSEAELRNRIKEDAEKQFVQQSDQKLLNDVNEHLIDSIKFDLPAEFLIKWIQNSGEEPLDEAQTKEEYERFEKGLRYQLIKSKLMKENDSLKVDFEDVKKSAIEMIKVQMTQFGKMNPSKKELDDVLAKVLSNEEEVKRISTQVVNQKLLDLYKEKANVKIKEVTYEDFVKLVSVEK